MSKRKKFQQVLVPKGTIDPNEDTVIQIPQNMTGQTLVVAGRKGSERMMNTSRSSNKSIQFDNDDRTMFTSGSDRPRTSSPIIRDDGHRSVMRGERSRRDSMVFDDHPPAFDPGTTNMNQSLHNTISLDELERTEIAEKEIIQRKLEDFQKARRTFLLETTNIATKSTQMPPPQDSFMNSSLQRSGASFRSAALQHSFAEEDFPQPLHESTFIARSPKPTSIMTRSGPDEFDNIKEQPVDLDDKVDEEFVDGKLSSCSKIPKTTKKNGILKCSEARLDNNSSPTCAKQEKETQPDLPNPQDCQETKKCSKLEFRTLDKDNPPDTAIVQGTQTSDRHMLELEDDDPGKTAKPTKPCCSEILELCPIRNIDSSCSRPGGTYLGSTQSSFSDRADDFVRQCRSEMRKQYNHNDFDVHYLEKLKNQFNEARRKLDEVISLVNMSLNIANSSAASVDTSPTLISCLKKSRQSVDIELPVRDTPDEDVVGPKKIENMKTWKKMDLTCGRENVKTIICKDAIPDEKTEPEQLAAAKSSCRTCKGSKNSLNK